MAVIEYFYAAHSAYVYTGSKLLSEIAGRAVARIDHRPFDWHRVVAANGPGRINTLTPGRRAYFSGREIERWAEYRGVESSPAACRPTTTTTSVCRTAC